MYSLGDKYDIPELRDLATAQLISTLNDQKTPHKDLLEAIPFVYECTLEKDRKLRDVVVLFARFARADIFKNAALKSQLADVLRSTPEFSMDMLASLTTTPVIIGCRSCTSRKTLPETQQCCEFRRHLCSLQAY